MEMFSVFGKFYSHPFFLHILRFTTVCQKKWLDFYRVPSRESSIVFIGHLLFLRVSLLAKMVKNLPAKRQTQVRSLGREDPLEKDMAPHSSTHAWRIPRTEEPGRLQSMGSWRVRHNWATSLSLRVSEEFWTGTLICPPKDSFSSCWETFL